jgi:hypothetical protein
MFSEPVIGEEFFGRQEVMDLLRKRVLALKDGYRQNVALTGQSLAGKSSILHHFLYAIKEEDLVPVYVEVVKEPFRTFANKFVATLLYNALVKRGIAASDDMGSLVEASSRALPRTYAAIKHINSSIDKGELDEAYLQLLGLTSVLKAETGISCIVILDEFDNLEFLGIKNPFLNFGKVIMIQKDTMYMVSSSRNEAIKKILSEKLSLLFGNFEIVRISGFDSTTALSFLETRLADFELEDGIKEFLVSFTEGNPFYLDKFVSRLKDGAISRMSTCIDSDAVIGAILDLVYNSNGVIHQYLFSYLLESLDSRHREWHLSILASIANGRNRREEVSRAIRATKRSEVSKGLAALTSLGILTRSGVFYRIGDGMLRFWLKQVYERRREMLVDSVLSKADIFSREIRAYLEDFREAAKKDTVTTLRELFDRFSNELVQIDSKYSRLPHFTKTETRTFPDGKPFVAASFRGKSWVVAPYEHDVSENDIVDYIRNVKALDWQISNKVIIHLRNMDSNAKLLAKELKITLWDLATTNMLLEAYGKRPMVIL